jgi:uncharacterized protein YyaL (SSP411 family)
MHGAHSRIERQGQRGGGLDEWNRIAYNPYMPNHLSGENSPYLLQHADNPVEWYPWGEEALTRAVREDKPIFLSIGYAACHWCHVMAHESFENPLIADILNQHFISIKVDREERPDIDGIYMNAVVAMTGSGGWPMSLFLAPDGYPFYGGTYFPPLPRHGLPAFEQVLLAVAKAWQNDRAELLRTGQSLAEHLSDATRWNALAGSTIRPGLLDQASQALIGAYSWQRGGWGNAPLFPQPMSIEFLLLQATRGNKKALEVANHSLDTMQQGGMYDIIGGGFHRYSTDAAWLIPHFEKMLYDNAQLALAYLHAHLISGDATFRRTTEETLDFILRELSDPQGGFYSSLDADSEGGEGAFYIWSYDELRKVIASDVEWATFLQVYAVTPEGNFEGHNILRQRASLSELSRAMERNPFDLSAELQQIHRLLLTARTSRPRPLTDDKVLVSWNALALRAFAQAARYLDRPDYLDAARRNAVFLISNLYNGNSLSRAWRKGTPRHTAFLEDYAAMIIGLLDLYQSDPNPRWFSVADQLAHEMVSNYADPQGGFTDTHREEPALYVQAKDSQDNATPCGNSLAALALLQMSEYTGRSDLRALAETSIAALQDNFVRQPAAFAMWLQASDFLTGPVDQVALIGQSGSTNLEALHRQIWAAYRPRLIEAIGQPPLPQGSPPLLENRPMLDDQPAAYVCRGFVCKLPVTTPQALENQLSIQQG